MQSKTVPINFCLSQINHYEIRLCRITNLKLYVYKLNASIKAYHVAYHEASRSKSMKWGINREEPYRTLQKFWLLWEDHGYVV